LVSIFFGLLSVLLVSATVNDSKPVISVSGLSSGAFFAVQYQVAFSSSVVGAGILAGGPYYCAQGMIAYAVTACMGSPFMISVKELVAYTEYSDLRGYIDSTSNLANHRVWMYSGTQDTVVAPGVMQALQTYYTYFVNASATQAKFNLASQHAFVTNKNGNQCNYLGTPFINNGNYDGVGTLLQWIHGNLKSPVTAIPSNIKTLPQSKFVPSGYTASGISFQDTAYMYLPNGCQSSGSGCIVHIALHGCEQTVDDIDDKFYTLTGYNEWAEANNIIVVYPQAKDGGIVTNPKGCFDWWGYTNGDYANKKGPQMQTVKNMVDFVVKTYV